jgi:HK97 family phage major capsid protein
MSSFISGQSEERANLIHQVREILDRAETEARGLTVDDLAQVDRLEVRIADIDTTLGVARRQEERQLEVSQAAGSFVPATDTQNAGEILRSMSRGEVRSHTFETRATLIPGSATVPVSFLDRVYGVARLVGPMLAVAEVINRTSGNDLRIPIYTAFSTATTTGAGSALSESNPTFDSLLLQPSKTGFIVPVANELLTDAGFDLEGVVAEQAGNAIGFAVNASTSSTLVSSAGSGITASSATSFTADNLIDLAFSVDGAARAMPGAGYMANTKSLGAMRKLKDTAGQYLYAVNQGAPDTFLGFPVYENPALADVATTTKSVLFGDFKAFKIAQTGLDVAVSADAYFANDVTAYRFTYRVAGGLTHAAKVKYLLQA